MPPGDRVRPGGPRLRVPARAPSTRARWPPPSSTRRWGPRARPSWPGRASAKPVMSCLAGVAPARETPCAIRRTREYHSMSTRRSAPKTRRSSATRVSRSFGSAASDHVAGRRAGDERLGVGEACAVARQSILVGEAERAVERPARLASRRESASSRRVACAIGPVEQRAPDTATAPGRDLPAPSKSTRHAGAYTVVTAVPTTAPVVLRPPWRGPPPSPGTAPIRGRSGSTGSRGRAPPPSGTSSARIGTKRRARDGKR